MSLNGINGIGRLPGVAYFERDAEPGDTWTDDSAPTTISASSAARCPTTAPLATIRSINEKLRAEYAFDWMTLVGKAGAII